ncbi:Dipeptide-binding ABC transporter, periplasmic substrate-binding component [Minicystis rosea]|nr:Dipeptide-binding ABC transporter, periplasmic substrate-binding component [Minicystis rosea]
MPSRSARIVWRDRCTLARMARLRVVPLVGALLFANACGPAATDAPVVPVQPAAPVAEAKPAPPAPITAGAIPGDAQIYIELIRFPAVLGAMRTTFGAAAFATMSAAVAKEAKLSEKIVNGFLGAIESVHLGGRMMNDDVKLALSIVMHDAQAVRDLVVAGVLRDVGDFGPHGRRFNTKAGDKDFFVWFEGPKLLAFGDEPMMDAVRAVVEGRATGLTDAQRALVAAPSDERRILNAFVAPALLEELADGHVTFPAPLAAAFALWEGGLRGGFRAAIAAAGVKSNLPVPPTRALTLSRRLPADTVAYVDVSTGLIDGRGSAGLLLAQLAAQLGPDVQGSVRELDAALAQAGIKLADVLGSLGGEGVIGVSMKPGVTTKGDLENGYALFAVQELSDAKPAEALLKWVRTKLAAEKRVKVRAEGTGFAAEMRAGPVPIFVRAKIASRQLFVVSGGKDAAERVALAVEKGKDTLGDDAAHARALSGLPPRSQLRLWLDLARALEIAAAFAPEERASFDALRMLSSGPKRTTGGLAFSVIPDDDRLRFELDEVNGISILGAMGLYGVSRYVLEVKTVEAKANLGAMGRAAVAAYEREVMGPNNQPIHRLCRSSLPVPIAVPRGPKHVPSRDPQRDFNTGDDASGWKCLKFEIVEPHQYQYAYIAGGPYKGPTRGGPDPGPNGFEVSAEGDLDGDGVTSLFTRTGVIDPKTGRVIHSDLWMDKELE